jgi:hypothetical protein
VVFRHFLELIFRPVGYCVNITVFVSHEIEIADWNGNWLCADPQEAADIDNNATHASAACAVNMVHFPYLVVICAVDGCAFEDRRGEFTRGESNMIGVIHF